MPRHGLPLASHELQAEGCRGAGAGELHGRDHAGSVDPRGSNNTIYLEDEVQVMTSESITHRRSELYEQVWQAPLRTIARRYGVSDVALGKICRKLRVPLPGQGYWARVRGGHETHRPPLP